MPTLAKMGRSLKDAAAATLLSTALIIGGAGCSDGGGPSQVGTVREELLTDSDTMMGWIREIVAQGIRRPGYAADDWTEQWARDKFSEFGLQEVTLDPVDVQRWEPLGCSVEAWHDNAADQRLSLPCFPVPFSAAADGLEAELVHSDLGPGAQLGGKIALVEDPLLALPLNVFTTLFATWWYDPDDEIPSHVQTLPFASQLDGGLGAAIDAGAIGFVGILGAPWETDSYYVPYDAMLRPIPGVWLSPDNGKRLRDFQTSGPTRLRMVLARDLRPAVSHNVTGVLRGAGSEWVVVGSHHDGPWASAVEDASGTAMVLAQARYWSRVPERERPHNLLFLLNAGHMSGGAGLIHFTTKFRDFISNDVVVEVHLEHAAREPRPEGGTLVPTDAPEWRWWFTSFLPPLENLVADAICQEHLGRSLIMPPEGFPPGSATPPTDAAFFHPYTPIVSFLTAPMYLFDEADTPAMVHEASLVPLTRAAVRVIEGVRDQTAAGLRATKYTPPRAAPIAPIPQCDVPG
jgi:hypothetical protein